VDISAISIWLPLVLVSAAAGFVGSLLGLGGGFIIVPVLTLYFGLDLRSAVGAALIAVIATSSSSSITYLKKSYANLELAAFLEISTVVGAIIAVSIADHIPSQILYISFSVLLCLSSAMMLKKNLSPTTNQESDSHSLGLNKGFGIRGKYHENGKDFFYQTKRNMLGFTLSGIAGLLSGLLGIGGGVVKVPTMNIAMGVPLKVASATSTLMVGMTAAATATLMLARGQIPLQVSAVVAIGVYLGARRGSRQLQNTSNAMISWIFLIFAFFIASQMFLKGISG
jgi:uncharacterized protein